MKSLKTILAVSGIVFFAWSCEKDKHIPPDVSFKTSSILISGDATVPKDTLLHVGFVAQMTEDELKTFNVSYAYDNNATTTTDTTITLSEAENAHYETMYPIQTRNQAGTEKWIFTITDRDGNIAQKQLVLTVH